MYLRSITHTTLVCIFKDDANSGSLDITYIFRTQDILDFDIREKNDDL